MNSRCLKNYFCFLNNQRCYHIIYQAKIFIYFNLIERVILWIDFFLFFTAWKNFLKGKFSLKIPYHFIVKNLYLIMILFRRIETALNRFNYFQSSRLHLKFDFLFYFFDIFAQSSHSFFTVFSSFLHCKSYCAID